MILGACIALNRPSTPFRCDAVQKCWIQKFDNATDFNNCITAANTSITTCQTGCQNTFQSVQTNAVATLNLCLGPCTSAAADCQGGCGTTLGMCIDGCEDAPDCEAECADSFAACVGPCNESQCNCVAACAEGYNGMLQGPQDDMIGCDDQCCANDTDNTPQEQANQTYQLCLTGCSKTYNDAIYSATNTFLQNVTSNCSPGGSGASVFLSLGYTGNLGDLAVPPVNAFTALAAAQAATYAQSECETQCRINYDQKASACDSANSPCLLACQKAWDAADIACTQTFYTAGGNPGIAQDNLSVCQLANQFALQTCQLQCCFNSQGVNSNAMCVKKCYSDSSDCEQAAISSCPSPLGDAVCDPSNVSYDSVACQALVSTWNTCLTAANTACATTLDNCQKTCQSSAPATVPCSDCTGVFY